MTKELSLSRWRDITSEEWYQSLIEDCKATITEAVFNSRWSLVEGYWNLGKRIREDKQLKKWSQNKSGVVLQGLAKDLSISTRTLHYALQAYDKFSSLDKIPNGKNITWNKLVTLYLPSPKEKRDFEFRQPTPYGENIFYLSAKWQNSRDDSWKIIKEGDPYPTLKRRSWFFHEDMREFSLREYAQVQTFPDKFKFIGTYEKIKDQIGNAVAPAMAKFVAKKLKGKTFGDIFAGCGGLSCGLEQAGKSPKWALELEEDYARTYQLNNPDVDLVIQDIKHFNPKELSKVDIIVGGPPCQGFSLSGKRFKDDPRNELYKEFVRFVKALKPKEFLMENVPQVKEVEGDIKKDFSELGYNVEGFLIKGEDIGMRQYRHRYFFYGHTN